MKHAIKFWTYILCKKQKCSGINYYNLEFSESEVKVLNV